MVGAMAGAQRARGPGPDALPVPVGRRWPVALVGLGVLRLALLAAWVPLTYLTSDLQGLIRSAKQATPHG
jgi:hypothetical protein